MKLFLLYKQDTGRRPAPARGEVEVVLVNNWREILNLLKQLTGCNPIAIGLVQASF
jgi:hypothetical protein